MGKKVKLAIPKEQKIKLEDLSPSDSLTEKLDDCYNPELYQQAEQLDHKRYKRISSLKNIVIFLFAIIITILLVLSIVRNINFKDSNNTEPKPQEQISLW